MRKFFANRKLWITVVALTLTLFSGSFRIAHGAVIAEQPDYDSDRTIPTDTSQYTSYIPTELGGTLPASLQMRIKGVSGQTSFTFIINEGACGLYTYGPFSYATYGVSTSEFTIVNIPNTVTFPANVSGCLMKLQASIDSPYFGGIGGYSYLSTSFQGHTGVAYQKWCSELPCDEAAPDASTRFIPPVLPTASSTVATSSPVTIGAHVYVNSENYVEGKTYLRMSFTNNTASLVTGSALQAWDTAFNNIEIPITASSTDLDISTTTDKFSIYLGKTHGTYQIVVKECPWYGFGLFCTTDSLVATSTYFYIGQKTGFDIDQEAGNLGIFGLAPGSDPFVSTTTNAVLDCNIGISFQLDKCLWSFVIPNPYLTNQVVTNFKSLPILGWPIRFVEIFITTTATTSLPIINYTFAEHNSFVGGVNIHFNPWQYMFVSGSLVKDAWVADDGSGNIWDIMGPFVRLVVYLTLIFYIIRRLTGLNWGGEYTTTETGSETVSRSEKLPDGTRKSFTHSITKRRKL